MRMHSCPGIRDLYLAISATGRPSNEEPSIAKKTLSITISVNLSQDNHQQASALQLLITQTAAWTKHGQSIMLYSSLASYSKNFSEIQQHQEGTPTNIKASDPLSCCQVADRDGSDGWQEWFLMLELMIGGLPSRG